MRHGPRFAWRAIVAALVALLVRAGMASPREIRVTSLEIARLDAGGEVRRWPVVEEGSRAATLADALRRCTTPEVVKFRPKLRVVVARRDGSETTFLALGNHVKIDGVAFRCPRDVEGEVERLWAEGPAAPR